MIGRIERCIATSTIRSKSKLIRFCLLIQTNLDKTHLGRFYSISDDIYKKLYVQHHGFPLAFREQCKTFREQCVLVRKPYLDLKNCVDALDLTKPTVRFIIRKLLARRMCFLKLETKIQLTRYGLIYVDGNFGAGKTMTLSSMVHYGYLKEFILVHIPWCKLNFFHYSRLLKS